jgi:hypothetical protein
MRAESLTTQNFSILLPTATRQSMEIQRPLRCGRAAAALLRCARASAAPGEGARRRRPHAGGGDIWHARRWRPHEAAQLGLLQFQEGWRRPTMRRRKGGARPRRRGRVAPTAGRQEKGRGGAGWEKMAVTVTNGLMVFLCP